LVCVRLQTKSLYYERTMKNRSVPTDTILPHVVYQDGDQLAEQMQRVRAGHAYLASVSLFLRSAGDRAVLHFGWYCDGTCTVSADGTDSEEMIVR
jgi:hypothetical protein